MNDALEAKIRALVTKVEQSSLSDSDKEALYEQMSKSLHSVVVPVLVKYMPKDNLVDLADNPGKVSVESVAELLTTAIQDGQAIKEVGQLLDEVVSDIETALQKGGIV